MQADWNRTGIHILALGVKFNNFFNFMIFDVVLGFQREYKGIKRLNFDIRHLNTIQDKSNQKSNLAYGSIIKSYESSQG